jgi:hypothetical protein
METRIRDEFEGDNTSARSVVNLLTPPHAHTPTRSHSSPMSTDGPLLESLTRRLAETPADFLAEPRIGPAGQVHVAAVVADLLHELGGPALTPDQAAALAPADARRHRNWLALVLVASWLLHDPWFRERGALGQPALQTLLGVLRQTAAHTQAPAFVTDPDRREELARLLLRELGLRPSGETEAQAQDRLTTLSTVERERVIRAAREAEERAQAIREAMARQAAEEAAAQQSRE